MKITVTFRHMETSPALQEYVAHRIDLMSKFLIKPTDVHVIMSVEKHRHRAEVVLHEQNFRATADEVSDDMYKSLDVALDRIVTQVKKHKEKIQEHQKRHVPMGELALHAEEYFS